MSFLSDYRKGLAGMDPRAKLITVGSALFVGARMSTITFLGVYFVDRVHIAAATVGAALFVESVSRGIAAPFIGALSDRLGRRPLILAHVALTAALLPAFLLVHGTVALFAWSALVGAAQGPYFSLSNSLLLDLVPVERRQSALSVNYTAISIGFTVGIAPAGWIAERGFEWLALSSCLGALAVGAIYVLWIRGPFPREVRPQGSTFLSDASRAVRDPRFVSFAALAIAFPIGIGLVTVPITLYAVESHVTESLIGILLSLNGLIVVILAIPVNARLEPKGPYALLPWAAAFVALSYAALAWGGDWPWLLASVLAFSVGEVLFSSALPNAVAALAPSGLRGAYQGAWGFIFALGIGAAVLLAGIGRDHVGWRWTWAIAAAYTLVSGILLHARRNVRP